METFCCACFQIIAEWLDSTIIRRDTCYFSFSSSIFILKYADLAAVDEDDLAISREGCDQEGRSSNNSGNIPPMEWRRYRPKNLEIIKKKVNTIWFIKAKPD